MNLASSVFVKASCLKTNKIYYLRYDLNACNRWILSEAINKQEYKRESRIYQGGSSDEIDISQAKHGPLYKGCPYCDNSSFVSCSCGQVHCLDSMANTFYCPTDQEKHTIGGGYIKTLKGKRAGQ